MIKHGQTFAEMFTLRVVPGTKRQLVEHASKFGEPAEVIRDVLRAFVEGRLTIIPPDNH